MSSDFCGSFRLIEERLTRLRASEALTFEVEHTHRDGHVFPLEVSASMVSIGKDPVVLAFHRDIAQRKQAEASLRKISVAVEQSPVTVVITDAQGRIEYVNPKFTAVTGYSAAEAMGQNPRILKSGHFSPETYQGLWATLTSGATWEGVFHNRKKNGDLFWEAATIAPIKDSEGRITNYVAIKEDITERRRAEADLLETKLLMESIVNSTPDMIWSVDPEQFRLLSFNHSLADYFSRNRGIRIRIGMGQEELFPAGKAREYWYGLYRRALAEGSFSVDYHVSAGTHVLNLNFNLLEREGRVFGISVSGRDFTAQRNAQKEILRLNQGLEQRVRERTAQLEATNHELEAFSYSVSHDLRAPLQIVNGFSEALLEDYHGRLDEGARKYLTRIHLGAQRMGNLIDDLMKLSKTSRSELKVAECDLSALCGQVVGDLAELDPGRGVEFAVQPGMRVQADPQLMRVVLENLLGNAWKFTSKVPKARIAVGEAVTAGGERCFFVRDNGAGFDMAQADQLFNAFKRLHEAAEFEGSGIGLAIVQRVIHRHGGRVWAEAKPGEGARFHFTLPGRDEAGSAEGA